MLRRLKDWLDFLTPRERFAYVGIVCLLLFGLGYLGADSVRQPAPVVFELPAPGSSIQVDVEGAVKKPGLETLKSPARVKDAIDAAGGLSDAADSESVNLSEALIDGEKLTVEKRPNIPTSSKPSAPAEGKISLSIASEDQLLSLPGVGPVTAEAILRYRATHGRFRRVEELLQVGGIGEKKLARLRPLVRP